MEDFIREMIESWYGEGLFLWPRLWMISKVLRESSMVSTGMVGSDLSRAVRISELERL